MKEQLNALNVELNGIKTVLDKLMTKQNSSVFDKLCGKCNDLFNDFNSKITVERAVEEGSVAECIQFLKELLNVCKKLRDYKMYLIEVITQNIGQFEQQENVPTITSDNSELTNNVVAMEKPKSLELTNQDIGNAA